MTTASAARPLLALRGVSKYFPGVRALEGVEFDLMAGEIHALMGENGAGKSTFVKILSGVHRPDGGEISLNGEAIDILDPTHARALGINPVHQELHLEPYLSVAENIFLGRQPINRLRAPRLCRDEPQCGAACSANSACAIDPAAPVGSISIAQRQIVAIARAISTRVPRHHFRRADLLADRTRGGPPLRGDPAPEPPRASA